MRSPIKGGRVAVPFNKWNPRIWSWFREHRHSGVDVMAKTGTPILAVSEQTVVRADKNGGSFGWWVVCKDARGRYFIYAHMSRIDVKVGQKVVDGNKIGLVGSTGNSSGPHVHFEVRDGKPSKYGNWGTPIDPTPWCK